MFTITRRWASNTTSRNAYYQTFHICSSDMGRTLAEIGIVHYGALTSQMLREKRPVLGGQVKIQKDGRHPSMSALMRAKLAGSYVEDVGLSSRHEISSEAEFRKELTGQFGVVHRDNILMALGMTLTVPLDVTEDATLPRPIADTSLKGDGLPEPELGESWGAW